MSFYLIPDIASDTVVSVIKDAFIRLQLSLQNCRGQCYDGAINMLGKRSGVAKQIQDIQKKAHPTHCHAHSLGLSVKDATSHCKILSDTVNNTNEIVKLVKFSIGSTAHGYSQTSGPWDSSALPRWTSSLTGFKWRITLCSECHCWMLM